MFYLTTPPMVSVMNRNPTTARRLEKKKKKKNIVITYSMDVYCFPYAFYHAFEGV